MDIVTLAGPGQHVAGQHAVTGTALLSGVVPVAACMPQTPSFEQRRPRDLRNRPTNDPQRPSAPSRWGT